MFYRRLEFVFDISQGPRILAFVDFSQHISFGIPKSYQFTDFAIKPSSANYERITIHKDGRIQTHFPLAQNFTAPWDGQHPPLVKWDKPWQMKEELNWGGQHPESIKNYFTRPKASNSGTLPVQLTFPLGVEETIVVFSLFHSLDVDIKQAPPEIHSPCFCTWVLMDSSPYALVSIANLGITQQCIQLKSVGRDYRV